MRALIAALAALAFAAPALAGPVQLRASPTDGDGRITLGELFDGAGAASGVLAATRTGETAVLDAAQLQLLARRHGLSWSNPQGFRTVLVSAGAETAVSTTVASASRTATVDILTYARNIPAGEIIQPQDVVFTAVQAHQAPADGADDPERVIGQSARRPLRSGAAVRAADLSSPVVVRRGEMIEVAFETGGVTLTLQARALQDGAVGERIRVLNTQSDRTIQAVAAAPGRAVVGPAAQAAVARGFN
ncbi:flagellar basal body P-ring formation chaperone FlgA [Brevundimonas sp. 2R-24]|uniref:Flagella basal body P-ring formation protein FlgA n=1 Tax=Peiella sedimenti TaxID=3061083 RepID=A0ABT8SM97_9CAUL|nr:flagellar basal body P-ring formation chaperone FlgA [Caulobacteraceae bacterium XZ-24]